LFDKGLRVVLEYKAETQAKEVKKMNLYGTSTGKSGKIYFYVNCDKIRVCEKNS